MPWMPFKVISLRMLASIVLRHRRALGISIRILRCFKPGLRNLKFLSSVSSRGSKRLRASVSVDRDRALCLKHSLAIGRVPVLRSLNTYTTWLLCLLLRKTLTTAFSEAWLRLRRHRSDQAPQGHDHMYYEKMRPPALPRARTDTGKRRWPIIAISGNPFLWQAEFAGLSFTTVPPAWLAG